MKRLNKFNAPTDTICQTNTVLEKSPSFSKRAPSALGNDGATSSDNPFRSVTPIDLYKKEKSQVKIRDYDRGNLNGIMKFQGGS